MSISAALKATSSYKSAKSDPYGVKAASSAKNKALTAKKATPSSSISYNSSTKKYESSSKSSDKKSSSSKSSSSKSSSSSNRTAAADAYNEIASQPSNKYDSSTNTWRDIYNNIVGIPTANAKTVPSGFSTVKQNESGIVGDLFDLLNTPAKKVAHYLGYSVPDLGLSEKLGINKNIPNPLQTEGDQPYVEWNPNGTVKSSTIGGFPSEDVLTGKTNKGPAPVPYASWDSYDQSLPTQDRRSQPVTSPYTLPFSPQSSAISSAYSLNAETPNTPVAPNNGTIQGLGGRGYFSSGQFGNGAGGYGIEGGLTGTLQDENSIWENMLYNINPKNWMKDYQNFRNARDDYYSGLQPNNNYVPQSLMLGNNPLDIMAKPENPLQSKVSDQWNSPEQEQWDANRNMNFAGALGKANYANTVSTLPDYEVVSDPDYEQGGGFVNNLRDVASGFLGETAYASEPNMLTYNQGKMKTPYGMFNPNEDMGDIASDQYNDAISFAGGQPVPDMGAFRGLANTGLLNQPSSSGSLKADTSSADAQAKAAKKAWKALQKSIESQYGQDVQTGTESLNKAKQEDLLKLSGMFNFANSDPNDEQRVQYQQRTMNDYTGRLNDLLAKLSSAKNQAYLSGEQGYQSQLGTIAQARAEAQAKVQQLAQSQQNQSFNQRLALAKLLGYGQKVDTTPQRSTNPKPEYDPYTGQTIDSNPYSPTYGEPMKWEN